MNEIQDPDQCAMRECSTGWRCPNPGTVYYTVGCVHEHLVRSSICDEHLAELEGFVYFCIWCPDHDCPMVVTYEQPAAR